MSSVRPTRSGKFELSIRSKLLPRPVYLTFQTEAEAAEYGKQVDALLDAGIVPQGLIQDTQRQDRRTLGDMLAKWVEVGRVARTELPLLQLLIREVGSTQTSAFTYAWCESWVTDMKVRGNYSPGTIRKRIGALSRCIDWQLRMSPDTLAANPLKLLPRGATSYTPKDAAMVAAVGGVVRSDVSRDRRLKPGELDRIMDSLNGIKRDGRERAYNTWRDGAAFRVLFLLILNTGMRLREAYTMMASGVDLRARVLRCKSSKQWYGREKWREVPIPPDLLPELSAYAQTVAPDGTLFPWWQPGDDDVAMARTTSRLSHRFGGLFDYAQCTDFTEHDLRHEATCRWFEMRDASGGLMFRDKEIDRIMGWAPGSKMSARYASFRAESLSERMWAGQGLDVESCPDVAPGRESE